MRKASVIRRRRNVIIRLPRDLDSPGVSELTVEKCGDAVLLRPARPSWTSLIDEPRTSDDFLYHRAEIIEDGRFSLSGDDEPLL